MEATGRVDSHIHPPRNANDSDQPSQRRAHKHPESRIVDGKKGSNEAGTDRSGKNNNNKNEVQEVDRGTIAAETQARYAVFQTGIALFALIFSAVGTGLLIWTLCETRKTAKASIASAKQARAAVRIARRAFNAAEVAAVESARNVETALGAAKITVDQFQRIADATLLQARSFMLDRRPILYPIDGAITRSAGDFYIITYDIFNIGDSIGFVKSIKTSIFERKGTIGNRVPLGEETINDTFFVRSDARLVLGRPVRKLKIDEEACNRIINNRLFIIVEGEIIYCDAFDKEWVSAFEFEAVIKSRRGGKLYWVPNGWKNEEANGDDAKS